MNNLTLFECSIVRREYFKIGIRESVLQNTQPRIIGRIEAHYTTRKSIRWSHQHILWHVRESREDFEVEITIEVFYNYFEDLHLNGLARIHV